MALGYSIMANKGKDVIPFSVRYVLNQSGTVVYNREKEVQETLAEEAKNGTLQIIPEATAYIIKQMLIGVAMGGTPTQALRAADKGNYKGESGGKTGSTSSYTNVWYAGFDPKYTSIVWMGFDKSSLSLGKGTTAAGVAAPIWGKMYSRWYNEGPYPTFYPNGKEGEVPADVIKGATCAFNGLGLGPNCPGTSNLFLKPITIAGRTLAVPGGRQCDGDRDHFRSMDLSDFLQKELEISDDELKP
jgi:penicillin-binding protein 1A